MTDADEAVSAVPAAAATVNGPEGEDLDWASVDWRRAEEDVRRLRQRIFTASQAGDLLLTASPWGLLEPCAVNSCLHGSEGAGTQQCVPATRLILGSNCRSAIATLVERQSRYTMLVHLPEGHGAITVRDGLLATIKTLPEHLRKSLTWDHGTELAQHREITLATKMDIYFCDPHSPWQRGSNENTNGLLRQYFPKGTDLSVHSPARLLEVATELNARPRKTLGGITPAQAMQRLLFDPETPIVATTPEFADPPPGRVYAVKNRATYRRCHGVSTAWAS